MHRPLSLDDYLTLDYPFQAHAEPDGGYTIVFPDLPGCMTVAESLADVSAMAMDAKRLWLETALARGMAIPQPSHPEEHSGKFNLRLPKSLHRRLAEGAAREDVSLNQYVMGLLSEGIAGAALLAQMRELAVAQQAMQTDLAKVSTGIDELRATMENHVVETVVGRR